MKLGQTGKFALPYLIRAAEERSVRCYGQLADAYNEEFGGGTKGLQWGRWVGLACDKLRAEDPLIPRLSSLLVNSVTRMPGAGYDEGSQDWGIEQRKAWDYKDWQNVRKLIAQSE